MSNTISSNIHPSAPPFHPEATTDRLDRSATARIARRPPSERASFALIGALKRAVDDRAIRDSRLSRGESYAAFTHAALARRSPRLAADFALRLENCVMNELKVRLGNRFLRATDTVLRELVREGYLAKTEARAVRAEALRYEEPREKRADRAPGTRVAQPTQSSATPSAIAPTDKGPTTYVDAPNGFLWKPSSDSDGLLAILLPAEWTDDTTKVEIVSPDGGAVLATGRPAGVGNGGRAHFRFDRAGGDFPPGSIIRVHRSTGAVNEIAITQPGIRNEGTRR